ncbi:bifunctional diaminohydroxyphosphoribosylaminopyrimidine deaminase/5-amino-6-(5-phosphoribosylamino)uracil reductase RibD [Alkaliphilus peptidifermentans]|uniref:Riboflavin biosynthesis protein RibD n=1 Tax=Alkaliphilus peptidifermentans DSM 18978 TaxID=1120976 RepID=A0A1G5J4M1_9FIRM|nr:bifunctional diaminohydroxyphosphoribosylaminopyrimidine deaminase/5-amino-6-(5-phosphoribosylamino)uracil reductase RibD [Alkaliphilus peptidifermentans]SCY82900.1 diaminohydroxyphosphoribosylaminopyrimidine deaminase / 5-amino-6-(5-phosphoribosylamino)uracil reductase [Alkaliphilus peptidifermentans DSM 18978]
MYNQYMKRVMELATQGWGKTRPNPLVGAVIEKNGKILAEGYHAGYGLDHAEVDALKQINYEADGATLYVNLEPCSHYGKTPPCVEAIIKSKIKTVIVGMTDPNPLVAGRGIEILRENGIEVISGVMENESQRLNEIFIKYITTNRPFCILKTAMTLDGKIATASGASKWITGEVSREYVHHIRNRVAGIMVGISTIMKDNPQLNTRLLNSEVNQPIRIIVDSSCKLPLTSNVVTTAKEQPTLVATTIKAPPEKIEKLQKMGVEFLVLPEENGRVDLKELMVQLGKMKVDSVLLEGGGTLNYSALESGIVDKVMTFVAPKILGGDTAITPVEGAGKDKIEDAFVLKNLSVHRFNQDIMIEGYIEGKD